MSIWMCLCSPAVEAEERVATGQLLLQSFYEERERQLRLHGAHHAADHPRGPPPDAPPGPVGSRGSRSPSGVLQSPAHGLARLPGDVASADQRHVAQRSNGQRPAEQGGAPAEHMALDVDGFGDGIGGGHAGRRFSVGDGGEPASTGVGSGVVGAHLGVGNSADCGSVGVRTASGSGSGSWAGGSSGASHPLAAGLLPPAGAQAPAWAALDPDDARTARAMSSGRVSPTRDPLDGWASVGGGAEAGPGRDTNGVFGRVLGGGVQEGRGEEAQAGGGAAARRSLVQSWRAPGRPQQRATRLGDQAAAPPLDPPASELAFVMRESGTSGADALGDWV